MEIPVVSFGIGGIGEYLQHNVNGWLVDEATPQVPTFNTSIK
jgi:glycosyltransferase involved in cell wall biosynthesis